MPGECRHVFSVTCHWCEHKQHFGLTHHHLDTSADSERLRAPWWGGGGGGGAKMSQQGFSLFRFSRGLIQQLTVSFPYERRGCADSAFCFYGSRADADDNVGFNRCFCLRYSAPRSVIPSPSLLAPAQVNKGNAVLGEYSCQVLLLLSSLFFNEQPPPTTTAIQRPD